MLDPLDEQKDRRDWWDRYAITHGEGPTLDDIRSEKERQRTNSWLQHEDGEPHRSEGERYAHPDDL
jgi:hypothetical protein